jgi:hypothetical protein
VTTGESGEKSEKAKTSKGPSFGLNMRVWEGNGEDEIVSEPGDIEEVEKRLRDIRREKRGHVRWTVSRHTAELALDAVIGEERGARRPSSKGRRRKKRKRLL